LNVIHQGKRPLPEDVARGLTVYLNATAVDLYFRSFNGHTQVNATDLRTMRFPSLDSLRRLGAWSKKERGLSQDEIDAKVGSLA
jgi:adenine-specific DNA-methyltransferase